MPDDLQLFGVSIKSNKWCVFVVNYILDLYSFLQAEQGWN